jgi:uncharacterized membrane protein HdeD (DUF308 family)
VLREGENDMAQPQTQPGRQLAEPSLLAALAEGWWLLLLRGIAAILFGVLAFIWPGLTLFTLVFLFAAFALVDGILALWVAIAGPGGMVPRWWLVVIGLLGIAAAVATFMWPGMTALVLLYFIASWAIVTGVFTVVGAIILRKEIEGEWLLVLSGTLSVLIGVFMVLQPGAGALALVWLIGAYAMVFGITLAALAFRLKKFAPA